MRAFVGAVVAFAIHVLGAEQAERNGRGLEFGLLAGELAVEHLLQAGFGTRRGQRLQQRRQAIVERQFVQRPAGAAFAPGVLQLRMQRRRDRIAGEGDPVVVVQVRDQLPDRLRRAGRGTGGRGCRRRGRLTAAAERQQQGERGEEGPSPGTWCLRGMPWLPDVAASWRRGSGAGQACSLRCPAGAFR